MLPFTEATWKPTYRERAVTSADDVDPRVQEVLVLDLAAAQNEDPDLVFMKELLREHDIRPPLECSPRGIRRGKDIVNPISPTKSPGECTISPKKRNYRQPPMASRGPQASPMSDLQGLPSSCHGCSPRSGENCCLNKETFLLAESTERRGSLV